MNVINNAGIGLVLWALDGKATDHDTLSNNTIELNQVTRAAMAASGVSTYYSNGIDGNHTNLVITNNTISFVPEGAGRKVGAYSNFGMKLRPGPARTA